MAELVVSTEVSATPQTVWRHLVDWSSHGEWMLLTDVTPTTVVAGGVGAGLYAVTRVGPLALRDPMTVTQWQPPPARPARCVVSHNGPLVRGAGAFEVEPLDSDRCRITWSEWVTLPLGLVGEIGWFVVRPLLRWGLGLSLRRLARLVESAHG